MVIAQHDKTILRDLARRLAEIARLPVMEERRRLWRKHNSLERERPMVLIFPEGSWVELLPESVLQCEDERARKMEWTLRHRIYWHEHIPDDWVFEDHWIVNKQIKNSGWGLEPRHRSSPQARGAWGFEPVVNGPSDLKKLRYPEIEYDEGATLQALAEAREVFDGILRVELRGIGHVSFHLMAIYSRLRGLEQVMEDMCENPGMLHEAMAFLEAGHQRLIEQYVKLNLFSLNNDDTYHSSGGVGYIETLPLPDCDPDRVRPCDVWASAEAQELAQVGPEMHDEFSLQYERRLLKHFGLNGYGCCEDLTLKLDQVFTIPHIRRISISPFADVDRCADKLGNRYIFSWKCHPSHLVGGFDEDHVRRYLRHAVDVTRGGVLEMILKDTHTCEHHPERFTQWARVAREVVEDGV
ncbi:MAG: hypothetical protein HY706_09595 [Candidatus Hydrogenedentes bacterium]|nr:hypothetical protein [Candidatus Hydrogenedentota bacterium]